MYAPRNSVGMGAGRPLAPRRGMGDTCPSLQQLMGITDFSDPCQAGGTSGTASSCFNTDTSSYGPCPISTTPQTTVPGATGPFGAIGSSVSSFFSQNPIVGFGLVGLAVLAIFAGGSKR